MIMHSNQTESKNFSNMEIFQEAKTLNVVNNMEIFQKLK